MVKIEARSIMVRTCQLKEQMTALIYSAKGALVTRIDGPSLAYAPETHTMIVGTTEEADALKDTRFETALAAVPAGDPIASAASLVEGF
jgi:hypothetical protein